VWEHTFYNALRVDPKDQPVMLTAAPMAATAQREKPLQVG
jgi:actin-related protein